MLTLLGRLIVVPIAFVIAMAVAAFVIASLGLERVTQAMSGRGSADSIGDLYELLRQGTLMVSGLTLLPALALVVVGEVARIRSSMYYVIGGGGVLAAVPFLARIGQGAAMSLPAPAVWQVLATAGFAGGFVYWLIAGRNA